MDTLRLGSNIRRVTVLEPGASGDTRLVVVFERRRKKKRQSRIAKPVERLVRAAAQATDRFAGKYVRRHKKSNTKRRDGWLRDGLVNVARAGEKARKRLDPARVLGL